MKKYVILAETGADIPAELVEKYGIYTVPMHVTFGQETRDDGAFPTDDIFQYYQKTGKLPQTSGSNIEDFQVILDRIHAEHPQSHILYLAYSSVTTCAYQSGLIAMEGRDYITAYDTKQVSAGQCLVVVLIARYLEEHPQAELDEVMAKVEEYSTRCHMGFFPGDLVYLRAGGRVSNAAYIAAKLLSLHPLIELQNGYLVGTKKYRGTMERVMKALFAEFIEKYRLSREILFFPYSPGFSEKTKAELEEMARQAGFQEIAWIQTGSVVSTHSGPGAAGVCGLSAK